MSRYRAVSYAVAALATTLVFALPAGAEKNRYQAQVVVSDGFVPGSKTDPNLVNGWGVAFNPRGFVWVADNGTGLSTLYDGLGNAQSLVVSIPSAAGPPVAGKPTGIVFNSFGGFTVTNGTKSGPAAFLFATEDGLIAGWAPSVDGTHALRAYPKAGDPPSGAVYKGLAIANNGSGNFLYATDFGGGKIDVFDGTFTKVNMAGG